MKSIQHRRAGGGAISSDDSVLALERWQHAGRGADQRPEQRHRNQRRDQKNASAPDSGRRFFVFALTTLRQLEGAAGLRQAVEHDAAQGTILFGNSVGLSGDGNTMGVGSDDVKTPRARGEYMCVHAQKWRKWAQQVVPYCIERRTRRFAGVARYAASAMTATPALTRAPSMEDAILPGIQPPNCRVPTMNPHRHFHAARPIDALFLQGRQMVPASFT